MGPRIFTPGVSMSTRKQEIPPFEPFERSVAAINWMKDACAAPVMNRFTPLMT